jgi:hypothetical protein
MNFTRSRLLPRGGILRMVACVQELGCVSGRSLRGHPTERFGGLRKQCELQN